MTSKNFKMWITIFDQNTCVPCKKMHGKIYNFDGPFHPSPQLHNYGRCRIGSMEALVAGTATDNGTNGADWWLKHLKRLPDYYISQESAQEQGWAPRQTHFHKACPNKMLFGGIYENKNGHLPSSPGRLWYEADINYSFGKRNSERVLFSNDGLIFVTYDHYRTFIEIV